MIDAGVNLKSDVLKVGHHGSDSSCTNEFLKQVQPDYAIISVGKDNDYGHPDDSTLNRLEQAGAQIFRTDMNGTIIVKSNGESISVLPDRYLMD